MTRSVASRLAAAVRRAKAARVRSSPPEPLVAVLLAADGSHPAGSVVRHPGGGVDVYVDPMTEKPVLPPVVGRHTLVISCPEDWQR